MLRITLLLGLAGLTGTTAAPAPKALAKAPAAVTSAVRRAPTAAEKAQAANVTWMGRYGFYNAKNGAWELLPRPGVPGC